MTKRTASRLANCYVPLHLPGTNGNITQGDTTTKTKNKQELLNRDSGDSGSNNSSRSSHALRRLKLESAVIPSATGSSLVELGHTKVICSVTAPVTEQIPPSLSGSLDMEQGTLHCQVKYLQQIGYPTSTLVASTPSSLDQYEISSGQVRSWTIKRETDLAVRLTSALAAAVPLRQYPKCAIIIHVTVLQDDGSVLPACITAASLALVDAAIEVYDLVTACSVSVVDVAEDTDDLILLADPSLEDLEVSKAEVTLAMLPNWKEVTLWEQAGRLSPAVANQAMELCRDGCRTMHKFMREHTIEQV